MQGRDEEEGGECGVRWTEGRVRIAEGVSGVRAAGGWDEQKWAQGLRSSLR